MSSLEALSAPFTTILCDIWGVIHDGGQLLPGAAERLSGWKRDGKTIILVTNAPRPASTVQHWLDALGLPRSTYDAITSSGEAGIAALTTPPRSVGFIGSTEDQTDLVAHGVTLVSSDYCEIACTGLDEWHDDPGDYHDQLAKLAAADVLMHCLNPDRIVIHRGRRDPCAGALADVYETLGGRVCWYGKPHALIYDHALKLAGHPPRSAVLAIGDGLVTDMLGAARYGIDAVFVSDGINAGQPVPSDFASRYDLGDWHPRLTVADLS